MANRITGDSRVQKTALAAARDGWDVTLIGRATGKRIEYAWFGPVKVIRVPVGQQMTRREAVRSRHTTPRVRLTQFGIKSRGEFQQLKSAHRSWVREQSARIGWLSDNGVTKIPAVGLKAWVRARREVHKLRVRAYGWEERRRPEERPSSGDWRRDWPALLDLDLAFGPAIEKVAPDVIHANDITMIHVAARAAARMRAAGQRCTWLYDSHEYVAGVEWPKPLMRSAYVQLEQEFIRKADAVVTVSPELAEILRKDHHLPKVPLVVRNAPVRESIGTAQGRVSVRAACGLDDSVPLLVYAGWIDAIRGLDTVVAALPDLPDHHLALVSGRRSVGLTELLDQAVELGVRDRIHVVPYVEQHEVPDYLASADLGVISFRRSPNVENSLPTKAAEYLHAGLPIISSDVRTLSAYVRNHDVGEVHTADDPVSFAAAVRRATGRLATLKGNITEQIRQDLSWEFQCEGLLALYRNLSGATPPPPAGPVSWEATEHAATEDAESAPGDHQLLWTPLTKSTPVRLGMGPANYAGQLATFAQAVCRERSDVSVEVVMHKAPTSFDYPADVYVDRGTLKNLDVQLDQVHRVLPRYTHLLADAFLPLFGGLNGDSIEGDLPSLRKAGIKVALLAHGSEVRLPREHMARNPYSLFFDAPEGYADRLGAIAERNVRTAQECGLPVFVTTPDLLHDLPMATWAPLVVDIDSWACDSPVMERKRPVVLHAPSKRWTKGTDRIMPVLQDLHERGAIDFQLAEGVNWTRMREMVQNADIVVDQFAVGSYGTFACEGMAAGKPVVAYLDAQVAEAIGEAPPIVNCAPDKLGETMERLLSDPVATAQIGVDSAKYVRTYHDGTATSRALRSFLAS
ncbi:glycosyltransferase family 4 protein [Streptomyces sp. NPDC004031]